MKFEILHTSKKSKARVGRIHTPHGIIDTPSFVAVGTNGTIKALDSQMVKQIGLQLMFCNTYHLLLQPGADVVEKAGSLLDRLAASRNLRLTVAHLDHDLRRGSRADRSFVADLDRRTIARPGCR